MPKVWPYPFRRGKLCHCKQICRSWEVIGEWLWVRCLQANGGFEFLREWFRLGEDNTLASCAWTAELDGDPWQGSVTVFYSPIAGVGVPAQLIFEPFIFTDFGGSGLASSSFLLDAQIDCRGFPTTHILGSSSQPDGGPPELAFAGELEFRWGNAGRPSPIVAEG